MKLAEIDLEKLKHQQESDFKLLEAKNTHELAKLKQESANQVACIQAQAQSTQAVLAGLLQQLLQNGLIKPSS